VISARYELKAKKQLKNPAYQEGESIVNTAAY
jgi:hypothetical protein